MALDKAALLKAPELRRKLVKLGDGEVWMREFSVGESIRYRARYPVPDHDEVAALNATICQIGHALCNEDGTPMLTEDEIPAFAEALAASPQERVGVLAVALQELAGLGEAALKEALGN